MPDPSDDEALVEALREALSLPPDKCFDRDIDAYKTDRLVERMAKICQRVVSSESDCSCKGSAGVKRCAQ